MKKAKAYRLISETQTFSCQKETDFQTEAVELCVILSGSGSCCLHERSLPCEEGEIYVFPPNVSYRLEAARGESMVLRRLCFTPDDWFDGKEGEAGKPDFLFGIFAEGAAIAYAKCSTQKMSDLLTLMKTIDDEYAERNNGWREMISAYLMQILILISRYIHSSIKEHDEVSAKDRQSIAQAIRMVELHYMESNFTLDSVAASLFVSTTALSRLFSQKTGEPFSDYLRSYRMQEACRLLCETAMSNEEIMAAVGMRDIPSFYRAFHRYAGQTPGQYRKAVPTKNAASDVNADSKKVLDEIADGVRRGNRRAVEEGVQKALQMQLPAEKILNDGLIPAMTYVGEKFKSNQIFIPEVLLSARALKAGSGLLKPCFSENTAGINGRVVIGTVKGDLHDIGKNIVKMMMEGRGLQVFDLGTDVPAEEFVKVAVEQNCRVVCLSALLTTTMDAMGDVVAAFEKAGVRDRVKILVGGAPVTEQFCRIIGADCYTDNAADAAAAAYQFCKEM